MTILPIKLSLIHRIELTMLVSLGSAISVHAQAAGFGLSVTPSASSVLVSNSITYTVNLTNLTGLTAGNMFVTNSFSAPVAIESFSFTHGDGVNYSGSVFTNSTTILLDLKQFTPASLIPGFAQATFTVVPQIGGFTSNIFFTNAVVAIAPDLQFVSNSASTNVVVQVTNTIVEADLGVSVTGFGQGILAGDLISYTVVVTNSGPNAVPDVLLTNALPPGTVLIGVSPPNPTLTFSNSVAVLNLGTLSNANSSAVIMTVQPTNGGVQTFAISVGAMDLVDPNPANNSFSTNIDVGSGITGQVIATIVSPMTFDAQTGLMDQTVRLLNVSTLTVDSVRLRVSGLTNWLYNAIGTNHGNPFVVYANSLNPNQSVDLILEYFVSTRVPIEIAQSNYTAVAVPGFNLTAPPGTNGVFSITRTVLRSDGSLLIEFPSLLGASYSILYSTNLDFSNALLAQPAIIAPADRVQWIDNGPPKTIVAPASTASRFYRVLKN